MSSMREGRGQRFIGPFKFDGSMASSHITAFGACPLLAGHRRCLVPHFSLLLALRPPGAGAFVL